MMYGFGDDECPLPETVDLVEVGRPSVSCGVPTFLGLPSPY